MIIRLRKQQTAAEKLLAARCARALLFAWTTQASHDEISGSETPMEFDVSHHNDALAWRVLTFRDSLPRACSLLLSALRPTADAAAISAALASHRSISGQSVVFGTLVDQALSALHGGAPPDCDDAAAAATAASGDLQRFAASLAGEDVTFVGVGPNLAELAAAVGDASAAAGFGADPAAPPPSPTPPPAAGEEDGLFPVATPQELEAALGPTPADGAAAAAAERATVCVAVAAPSLAAAAAGGEYWAWQVAQSWLGAGARWSTGGPGKGIHSHLGRALPAGCDSAEAVSVARSAHGCLAVVATCSAPGAAAAAVAARGVAHLLRTTSPFAAPTSAFSRIRSALRGGGGGDAGGAGLARARAQARAQLFEHTRQRGELCDELARFAAAGIPPEALPTPERVAAWVDAVGEAELGGVFERVRAARSVATACVAPDRVVRLA